MVVEEAHMGVMHMDDSIVTESCDGSEIGMVADVDGRSDDSRDGSVEHLLSPDCDRFMLDPYG
jgi:hypothetical protein